MEPKEAALREEIVRVGRLLHRQGLVDGTAGNISARLAPDRVLITPSGLHKGFLEPEQLLVVDLEGRPVGGSAPAGGEGGGDRPALRPTSELPMHLQVYRERPDVGGVVHAHPPYAVALSIADVPLATWLVPEAVVLLGPVPTLPYATPSSEENREVIEGVVARHDALILRYHGTLTVGRTPWEAYLRLETLEQTARLTYLVRTLGGGEPLPFFQVQKLLAQRARLGLLREGEEAWYRRWCE